MRPAFFGYLLLGWSGLAHAQSCPTVDRAGFTTLVLSAQDAVDRGDLAKHVAATDAIEAAIPCLGFAPTPREWSDTLVTRAIHAFSQQQAWQPLMATALRIRPSVDRFVAQAHPLSQWQPAPGPFPSQPLPQGHTIYVDGVLATSLPLDGAEHLVQRQEGQWWSSILLVNAELPDGWLDQRLLGPKGVRLRAEVSAGASAQHWAQHQQTTHNPWVRGADQELELLADVQVLVTTQLPLGLAGRLQIPTLGEDALRPEGGLDAVLLLGGGWLGLGLGAMQVTLLEGVDGRRTRTAPLGELAGHLQHERISAELVLGVRQQGGRLALRLSHSLSDSSPWGLTLSAHRATLPLSQNLGGVEHRVRWTHTEAALLITRFLGKP